MELAAFLKHMSRAGRYKTGDAVLKRVAQDNTRLRGRAYQVVWALDGTHIAEIHPQPFRQVACGPLNDDGGCDFYWLCRDWKRQGQFPVRRIPAFNPDRARLRKAPTPAQVAANEPGDLEEPVQLYRKINEDFNSPRYD